MVVIISWGKLKSKTYYLTKRKLVINHMIPNCQDEISIRLAGTWFTNKDFYIGKLSFLPVRRDIFPPGICLHLFSIVWLTWSFYVIQEINFWQIYSGNFVHVKFVRVRICTQGFAGLPFSSFYSKTTVSKIYQFKQVLTKCEG